MGDHIVCASGMIEATNSLTPLGPWDPGRLCFFGSAVSLHPLWPVRSPLRRHCHPACWDFDCESGAFETAAWWMEGDAEEVCLRFCFVVLSRDSSEDW